MSVELKSTKTNDVESIIDFSKKSNYKVVVGLKGSFFEGENKVLYITQAEKLIEAKLAKEVKDVEFEIVKNNNIQVMEVPSNN